MVAACGEIETRCVNIIARLFHAPEENGKCQALGVSTIGSSEAIILSVINSHPSTSRGWTYVIWHTGACRKKTLATYAQGSGKALRQT
jgi:hypothetical protein